MNTNTKGATYEFQHYCRHHCTYRRSAAGSDQPDAERHGQEPAAIESTTVEQLVTAGITTIAALVAWWKNNSFTKEAIAADKEYDRLKAKSGK